MKIVYATKNFNKFLEAVEIIKNKRLNIELICLKDFDEIEEPLENGQTFYDNALIKAQYYYNRLKVPVISDDSGLIVEALNNQPGVFSARYAQDLLDKLPNEDINQLNRQKLLSNMKDITDRQASFVCSSVYYDGINIIDGFGKYDGEIAYQEKGSLGFGYDCIFIDPHYQKTFSEIPKELKNTLSHRYQSLKHLFEQLIAKKIC